MLFPGFNFQLSLSPVPAFHCHLRPALIPIPLERPVLHVLGKYPRGAINERIRWNKNLFVLPALQEEPAAVLHTELFSNVGRKGHLSLVATLIARIAMCNPLCPRTTPVYQVCLIGFALYLRWNQRNMRHDSR